jgi:hypothetical protein
MDTLGTEPNRTHPMHPGLGVLIHSHQFRCSADLCENKLPAGALESSGQLSQQIPPTARRSARTSCKHCRQAGRQELPREWCPDPPRRQHCDNRPLFVISTTSLFVCRLRTRFRAPDSYSHVTLLRIIRVFSGNRLAAQLSQFERHRCPSGAHVTEPMV